MRWMLWRTSAASTPSEREISTTMAFVQLLQTLCRDKAIGSRVVPIVPDEARTFGMEGMFRQYGIWSTQGQNYVPQDADQLMFYREDNAGQVLHELVIGTDKELQEHAELMKKHPNMEHDEPYMAHVPPGQRGDIVWTFNRPGDFEFACLIAGHYEAGMVGGIAVRSA